MDENSSHWLDSCFGPHFPTLAPRRTDAISNEIQTRAACIVMLLLSGDQEVIEHVSVHGLRKCSWESRDAQAATNRLSRHATVTSAGRGIASALCKHRALALTRAASRVR